MRTAEEWVEEFYARGLMSGTDEANVAFMRAIQLDAMEAQHRATMAMFFHNLPVPLEELIGLIDSIPRPEPEGECTEP